MADTIHYSRCPVCDGTAISEVLKVKDYTVSKNTFPVYHCAACTARFTQDVPDAASIAPYYQSEEYISHTNTSKGFINSLYQRVRKRTIVQKRKLINKSTGLRSGSLLDIGAGTGTFVHEMEQSGWQAIGLEPDAGARQTGQSLYHIELSDISRFYSLPDDSYDAITLWHVLEHVHDLHGYLSKLNSLLKKNGRLFIAVPNYTSSDAAAYKENWAAYDVPRHLYHFSPEAMKALAEKHGLEIEQYRPMWFDSFYVSLLSSKYKNEKTNLIGAFFAGLISNLKAIGNVKRCSSVIYIIRK